MNKKEYEKRYRRDTTASAVLQVRAASNAQYNENNQGRSGKHVGSGRGCDTGVDTGAQQLAPSARANVL